MGYAEFLKMVEDNSASGTLSSFARACYKETSCGAWVAFEMRDGMRLGAVQGRCKPDEWVNRVREILVGSIVEGSDAEIGPYRLPVDENFNPADFWALLARVDEEASDAWDEAQAEEMLAREGEEDVE